MQQFRQRQMSAHADARSRTAGAWNERRRHVLPQGDEHEGKLHACVRACGRPAGRYRGRHATLSLAVTHASDISSQAGVGRACAWTLAACPTSQGIVVAAGLSTVVKPLAASLQRQRACVRASALGKPRSNSSFLGSAARSRSYGCG